MFQPRQAVGAASPPSFFEVVMIARMEETFRPAIHYAVSVLSERWPRLNWVMTNFDEAFAVTMGAVQGYHLRTCDALQAEYFYGFKRVQAGAGKNGDSSTGSALTTAPLSPAGRARALFCAAVAPYLSKKAHDWYEREAGLMTPLGVREAPRVPRRPPVSAGVATIAMWRLRRCVREIMLHLFPPLHLLHQMSCFGMQAAFLLGRSRFHSPLSWLTRQALARLMPGDVEQMSRMEKQTRMAS